MHNKGRWISGIWLDQSIGRKQYFLHDDVIEWKHFPRYWPFLRGIHRWPVNSPHKDQWRGNLMFSLICAWINAWVNNREAGDLRRRRAHYDVIVMISLFNSRIRGTESVIGLRCARPNRGFHKLLLIMLMLTHRGREKVATTLQMTFSNACDRMKSQTTSQCVHQLSDGHNTADNGSHLRVM